MQDLISRQAAIDALESIGSLDTNADREYARSVFETLPSAQPEIEPKTGHWVEDAKTYYEELKKRSLGVDEYTPYFTDDIACSECAVNMFCWLIGKNVQVIIRSMGMDVHPKNAKSSATFTTTRRW